MPGAAGADRLGERALRQELVLDLAALAAATASGFEVKNEAMALRMRPWRSSLPRPRPASPMLFETIVRSRAVECSTSASISVSGAPTRPKPPTMTVSPARMRDDGLLGRHGRRRRSSPGAFKLADPAAAHRAASQAGERSPPRRRYAREGKRITLATSSGCPRRLTDSAPGPAGDMASGLALLGPRRDRAPAPRHCTQNPSRAEARPSQRSQVAARMDGRLWPRPVVERHSRGTVELGHGGDAHDGPAATL